MQVDLGAKPFGNSLCSASWFPSDSDHRLGPGLFIFLAQKPLLEPHLEQPVEFFHIIVFFHAVSPVGFDFMMSLSSAFIQISEPPLLADEFALLLPYHQNRAGRVANHTLSRAAEQNMGEPSAALCGNNDQVRLQFSSGVGNLFMRRSLSDERIPKKRRINVMLLAHLS
jgi:hypothetical protein